MLEHKAGSVVIPYFIPDMFKLKMWSIRNGVGPRGKSQERFVGQLLGFRWSSTGLAAAESVPAPALCKGRAAAWQCQSAAAVMVQLRVYVILGS